MKMRRQPVLSVAVFMKIAPPVTQLQPVQIVITNFMSTLVPVWPALPIVIPALIILPVLLACQVIT